MRKIIFFILIFLVMIASSCNKKEIRPMITSINEHFILDVNTASANSLLYLFGDTLVAMEIADKKSTDPYKKYKLEFMGHCYACDLANIIITSKSITLENSCDRGVRKEYLYQMIKNTGDQFVITAETVSFIFDKIDEAPIYRLTIKGEFEKHKELRISEYFTTKMALPRFEIHDCGEFDG